MASQKKINKLKNAYLCKSGLKNKAARLKGVQFYTPSQRRQEKRVCHAH